MSAAVRTKLLVTAGAGALVGLLVPLASAHAATPSSSVPPACVVAQLHVGGTLQVGYAPTGPAGCQKLP